jgi:hypothetical protein
LLEYDPTVEKLVNAGMRMINYDPADKWNKKKVTEKVIHGVNDGMQKPLDGEEEFRIGAEANCRHNEDPQYRKALHELIEALDAQRDAGDHEGGYGSVGEQEKPKQEPPKPKSLLGELNAGDDTEKPPPRGWLYGNIFARKFPSTLFGDGGIGKTALRYAQYISLATGRKLLSEHIFQRCRVLIVSLEDDLEELRRRIWALRIHYGIEQKDLNGWLILWAPGIGGGKLLEIDGRGNPYEGELRINLEKLITHYQIDLVGIDPFVKTHGVGENNNSLIDMVVQILANLCHKKDIAIDVPHHVSKMPVKDGEQGDANRGRGASAMKDAMRLVYTLSVMSKDEAKVFGIKEEDRRAYVRMDKGKVNIVPPLQTAKWFHLIGVRIGNETELYPNGDEVQAVEDWLPPDILQDISEARTAEILDKIDAGLPDGSRYSDASSAKTRAAWKAVVAVYPGKNEKQAREIIKAWVKAEFLVSKTYHNPKARKDEDGLWTPLGWAAWQAAGKGKQGAQ